MTTGPIPTVVVPPLANGSSSSAAKRLTGAQSDDDDDLTSLDSEADIVVVAARPVLASKPPTVKKGGVDGEAKPKKRKGKDMADGAGKPKKPKATTDVAGTSAGPSGEGKAKTRAPKGTFIRCHQCRNEFTDVADPKSRLLQCSKLKPRTLTKAECDAKGLSRSNAPTVMERCKTTWCSKCLRSR